MEGFVLVHCPLENQFIYIHGVDNLWHNFPFLISDKQKGIILVV